MDYLSNKYLPELFYLIPTEEILPGNLEPYHKILREIVYQTQYNRSLRNIIFSLAVSQHDLVTISDCVKRQEIDRLNMASYQELLKKSLAHFDLNSPVLVHFIEIVKNNTSTDPLYSICDLLNFLSQDYVKPYHFDHTHSLDFSTSMITSFREYIQDDLIGLSDFEMLKTLNPGLGAFYCINYDAMYRVAHLFKKTREESHVHYFQDNLAAFLLLSSQTKNVPFKYYHLLIDDLCEKYEEAEDIDPEIRKVNSHCLNDTSLIQSYIELKRKEEKVKQKRK